MSLASKNPSHECSFSKMQLGTESRGRFLYFLIPVLLELPTLDHSRSWNVFLVITTNKYVCIGLATGQEIA